MSRYLASIILGSKLILKQKQRHTQHIQRIYLHDNNNHGLDTETCLYAAFQGPALPSVGKLT